jgi:restriction endonuclease Mrr
VNQKPDKAAIDAMFAAQEREQVIFVARNSTPTQRIQWLEQAVNLLRKVTADRQKEGLPTFLDLKAKSE